MVMSFVIVEQIRQLEFYSNWTKL